MDRATLLILCRDDLIALIEAQAAQISHLVEAQAQQIGKLVARIAELEAKLGNPAKIPDNSSLPPSKGQKPNLPDRGKKSRSGRSGVARALTEHPDRIIEATLAACPHCDHALGAADMTDIHAYDHIELPPIRPTRHAHQPPSRRLPLLPPRRLGPRTRRVRTRLAVRPRRRGASLRGHHPTGYS